MVNIEISKNQKGNLSLKGFPIFTSNYSEIYKDSSIFNHVEIEINSKCNRKCVYCPNSKYNRGNNYMKEALYEKIINDLQVIKFKGLLSTHFYGEPLLHPKLTSLIEYTKKKLPDCKLKIFTNGDFLTKKIYMSLVKAGVDEFLITAHDSNALSKSKKLKMLLKDKSRIIIQTIDGVYKMNRGGLLDIKPGKIECCNYPSKYLVINYKGEVVLCCNDYFCKYVFGDLKKEDIINIWNKKEFQKVRTELKSGIFKFEICKKCIGK